MTVAMNPEPMHADLMPSSILWGAANDYCKTARLLYENRVTAYSGVLFNLICQSIESALKGFLRAKGRRVEDMKQNLGHNLVKALKVARDEGIEDFVKIDANFEYHLTLANEYNRDKEFEYYVAGLKPDMPREIVLLEGTEQLVNGIKKFCISNVNLHHHKPTAFNPYLKQKPAARS
ncbi:MAG TPA: hypothetical protein VNL17_01880 [Verrucomicrobiae bacterium]|nr:hypothetical protein [Verrucomicrobiae bacterium]